jgi:hypothetical protein
MKESYMKRAISLVVIFGFLSLLCGCQVLTPEQRAKADAAQSALQSATQELQTLQTNLAAWVAEYQSIKSLVDAGQTLPAAVLARYSQLRALIAQSAADVQSAIDKCKSAQKAYDDAIAAGSAWYNNIPWQGIAGILLGIAGIYFPVVRPAAAAAQAIIQGVAATTTQNPAAGQLVKNSVLEASRTLGVEARVDALVQKYDPPRP